MGARAGKHKLGARTGKYKFGARAGKYKLGARVGKYTFGARRRGPGPGLGAKQRGEDREIQIPSNLLSKKIVVIFFYLPGKILRKQLYNLRCCKTMQLEIGGLATKICFVYCLQPVVHYFKGKSVYF